MAGGAGHNADDDGGEESGDADCGQSKCLCGLAGDQKCNSTTNSKTAHCVGARMRIMLMMDIPVRGANVVMAMLMMISMLNMTPMLMIMVMLMTPNICADIDDGDDENETADNDEVEDNADVDDNDDDSDSDGTDDDDDYDYDDDHAAEQLSPPQ